MIPGMVKLVLKKTNARTGRNPATGQPIPIAAKTVANRPAVEADDGASIYASDVSEIFGKLGVELAIPTARFLETRSPIDGKLITSVPSTGADELNQAIARCQ